MKLILKYEKQVNKSKFTYELFDNHELITTVDPNPNYDKRTCPWPIVQEELSWSWDTHKKCIRVNRRYNGHGGARSSTRLYEEEKLLTEAYLAHLEALLVE